MSVALRQDMEARVRKGSAYLFLAALWASSPAFAQVDCEKLRTSDIPYQVTFDVTLAAGMPDIAQVFRQPDGLTISYRGATDKPHVAIKQLARNGFAISASPVPPIDNLNLSYSYSIDTSKISLNDKIYVNYMETIKSNKGESSFKIKLEFTKQETMIVGSCAFKVYVYRITREPAASEHQATTMSVMTWSPELKVILAIDGRRSDKSDAKQVSYRANSINTSFTQLSDQ
jgi:hypothetical protein